MGHETCLKCKSLKLLREMTRKVICAWWAQVELTI